MPPLGDRDEYRCRCCGDFSISGSDVELIKNGTLNPKTSRLRPEKGRRWSVPLGNIANCDPVDRGEALVGIEVAAGAADRDEGAVSRCPDTSSIKASTWGHSWVATEVVRPGSAIRLFQAWQHASTMALWVL
jgi:hypothetical protein